MMLKEMLKKGIYSVPFTKKDGSKREMLCTLMANMLPETKGTIRELPENLLTVFDIEISQWRTINLSTVFFNEIEELA